MEDLTNTCSKYPHPPASTLGFMASVSPSIYWRLLTNQLREQKTALNLVKAQVGISDWNFALTQELATAANEIERNSLEKTNYPQISILFFKDGTL